MTSTPHPCCPRFGPLSLGLLASMLVTACAKSAIPILPEKVVGHCIYVNKFSQGTECRDYVGEWSDTQASQDCKEQGSTVVFGEKCAVDSALGDCILGGDGKFTRITVPGDNASKCGSTKRGCELFGGGIFDAAPICGGVADQPSTGSGLPVFRQPIRVCVDAKPGEEPGRSDGGQVCTWEMISAATEEGRRFEDYASCDRVRTQRPYYAAPTADNATRDDERLNDPTYAAEHSWVKSQILSTACVCCHSTSAPSGTSNWYVDQPGNFLNGFYPRGIAMGAGWIDTVGFGTFPKEENNGFVRADPLHPNDSIFVTTDMERIKRFFENEAAHRGLTRETFAGQQYGAGPLDSQRFFRPAACENGEGVKADGTLTWIGGKARYVYVLEADAPSPTVPPNLDLPAGTLWKIDVPHDGQPVESGAVVYGQVPTGFSQEMPASGAPSALESGKSYYLYVLEDIAIPITRCLFTAP